MVVTKKSKWKLLFSKLAQQDSKKLKNSNLKSKAEHLLDILEIDPFKNPPPYKKLVGDFKGFYSRRINIKHRLVYCVEIKKMQIVILSMWHHYND